MTQSLEALARHEKTLSSIRGIVRTMKSLAAINASPYEQAAIAIEGWQETVRRGFAAFTYRMGPDALAPAPAAGRALVVAFGSDHGFCGNYNDLLARELSTVCQRKLNERRLLCVGARLEAALQEHALFAEQRLAPPASVDGVGRLAGEVVAWIERNSRGQSLAGLPVYLAYTRRAELGSRLPVVEPLLPLPHQLLQVPVRWPSRALPDFSMPSGTLLSVLIRNYLFAGVFRASAEAMVTENAARLALMQQAEQSVDERLDELKRQISGVRQDEITNELMDIVISH